MIFSKLVNFSEKFESVTILFSDIVTFTNIAAACTPMDIVNLLNNLYHRFDNLTTVHDVYKACLYVVDNLSSLSCQFLPFSKCRNFEIARQAPCVSQNVG